MTHSCRITVSAPGGSLGRNTKGGAHLEFLQTRRCALTCFTEQGRQPIPTSARPTRAIRRAVLAAHPATPIPRAPGRPCVPGTLLHCGADKLADQRQELLRVPGVKLLQQGEQSQNERRPVHGVGRFSADHPCKATQVTGHASRPGTSLWRRLFRANVPESRRVCGPHRDWHVVTWKE